MFSKYMWLMIIMSPIDTSLAFSLAILPKNIILSKLLIPNILWLRGERRAVDLRERQGHFLGQ